VDRGYRGLDLVRAWVVAAQACADQVLALGDQGAVPPRAIEVTGGTVGLWSELSSAAARDREAYFADYAERVRSATRLPLMLTGGIRRRATMRRLLGSGAVDVVGLARALAVQTDLPAAALRGDEPAPRPWPPTTRRRAVGFAIHSPWHGLQIRRLAEGRDPDPAIGSARVVREIVTTTVGWRLGRERGVRPSG
jgi:hypothetical protein